MADENVFAVGATMAGHYGASARTGVTLAETTFAGAWNVQGDARRPELAAAVRTLFALSLPERPNSSAREGACTALWIGPGSWLIVASDELTRTDFEVKRDALNAAGGALFDVSAGRVGWTIVGSEARAVLAKGCPLDFGPRAFGEGTCAQSVFGRINALFYRHGGASEFTMMVARSFARDAWRSLCLSAAQYGYDVLHPRPF